MILSNGERTRLFTTPYDEDSEAVESVCKFLQLPKPTDEQWELWEENCTLDFTVEGINYTIETQYVDEVSEIFF